MSIYTQLLTLKFTSKKKFFGIKIKKPDYSNRLFNKELGGGAILDIGCYPLSLSTFINSITYKVQLKDIILENVFTEHCESGVDIFSNLKIMKIFILMKFKIYRIKYSMVKKILVFPQSL